MEIRVLYEKAKDSKLKYNEAKLEQEVEAIREQSEAVKAKKAQEQKEEKKEEKSAPKALPVEKTVIKSALRVPNHLEKAAIRLYVRLRMIRI